MAEAIYGAHTIAALNRLTDPFRLHDDQDVEDASTIRELIEHIRAATSNGDHAVIVGWGTAVEAERAIQTCATNGAYKNLMADDASLVRYALAELSRVTAASPPPTPPA